MSDSPGTLATQDTDVAMTGLIAADHSGDLDT